MDEYAYLEELALEKLAGGGFVGAVKGLWGAGKNALKKGVDDVAGKMASEEKVLSKTKKVIKKTKGEAKKNIKKKTKKKGKKNVSAMDAALSEIKRGKKKGVSPEQMVAPKRSLFQRIFRRGQNVTEEAQKQTEKVIKKNKGKTPKDMGEVQEKAQEAATGKTKKTPFWTKKKKIAAGVGGTVGTLGLGAAFYMHNTNKPKQSRNAYSPPSQGGGHYYGHPRGAYRPPQSGIYDNYGY